MTIDHYNTSISIYLSRLLPFIIYTMVNILRDDHGQSFTIFCVNDQQFFLLFYNGICVWWKSEKRGKKQEVMEVN